ncbi:hypothetical protein GBN24_13700 [Plesiomonas shigelloides]|uniref:hypothetical protein n=1 Tax=Plesiomonas shigelloides TaxID=703 RepID=UPI0012622BF3|nr:hypothetical protein [Plesiomonas shigelloides]KAB7687913.1 hypothetical protein GBN24_13700 [Plesiomonas shigelloides]
MSKYLIIEDDINKANVIKDELSELGIHKTSIDHVKSIKGGLGYLKTTKYCLIILDLNIPATDTGNPLEKGGVIFLQKLIADKTKYIKPTQIIGLTAYPNLVTRFETEFSELDFSLKDYSSSSWKTTIRNRIEWNAESVNGRERVPNKNIIVSIHGIRTLGKWQNRLEHEIIRNLPEFEIKTYRYNYFSCIQLLLPFARKKIIKHFREELILIINSYPNAEFHFISHSFGTYVLANAIRTLPIDTELKVKNIILAGSVLKEDFQWAPLKNKFGIENIINECGYNDNILLLSKIACFDMGMAGRRGFMGCDEVINRFYLGGHDFFDRESNFMSKYWLPFFHGDVTTLDERKFGFIRENFEIFLSTRINIYLTILLVLIALIIFF